MRWYLKRVGKNNEKNCKWFQTHIIFTDILNLKTKENTDYTYSNIFLKRKNKRDEENRTAFIFKAVSLLL